MVRYSNRSDSEDFVKKTPPIPPVSPDVLHRVNTTRMPSRIRANQRHSSSPSPIAALDPRSRSRSPLSRTSGPPALNHLSRVRTAVNRDYYTRFRLARRSVTPESIDISISITSQDVEVKVANSDHVMISTALDNGRARFSRRYPNDVEGGGVATSAEVDTYIRRDKRKVLREEANLCLKD